MGPAADVAEVAGLPEVAAGEAVEAEATCCGACCTGARRTGRSPRDEPHCGAAPGVHGAVWPGPESAVVELAAGSCCGCATVGSAGDLMIDPASSPVSSGVPPCATVTESVTADPANSAPRMRAVGLHELGDADEWLAAIGQARSLSRFAVRALLAHHHMTCRLYRELPTIGGTSLKTCDQCCQISF